MAKYDQGGGCACGLYKECECERRTQADGSKVATQEWTQRMVHEWAVATFGFTRPETVAIRLNREMSELLTALHHGKLDEARKEVADLGVMLYQVAELLGVDLQEAVSEKMEINERRRWVKTAAGDYQHA